MEDIDRTETGEDSALATELDKTDWYRRLFFI